MRSPDELQENQEASDQDLRELWEDPVETELTIEELRAWRPEDVWIEGLN